MPDMDGLEVLQELKNRNYTSKIFVISADKQQSSIDIALDRGAVDFLAKPVDASLLMSMLQQHEVI